MPPLGFSAVPLPNSLNCLPVKLPVAEAPGDFTEPEVVVVAAGLPVVVEPSNSRRVNAAAVHNSGPAAGAPPPPPASQDASVPPNPDPVPVAAAAVITAAELTAFDAPTTDLRPLTAATEAGRAAAGAGAGAAEVTEELNLDCAGSIAPEIEGANTFDAAVVAVVVAECFLRAGAAGWKDARGRTEPVDCAPAATVLPNARGVLDETPLEEPPSSEPDEPGEPVVSAKATADVDATAAPTPKATASAPTRPT